MVQIRQGQTEAPNLCKMLANPKQPIEIQRTIHSFDPCIACAVHVADPDGNELSSIRIV